MDIKSAFVQGDCTERKIFVNPPKEANRPPDILWKLRKAVFGLADANRKWYSTVKDELLLLGCVVSAFDKAVFMWYHSNNILGGIFILHVDDFIHSGIEQFHKSVIAPIKLKFQVGSESEGSLRYIGLDIVQTPGVVELSQNAYASCVN